MTDGFAGFIDVIDQLVSGLGGLETILLMISTAVLNKMTPALTNMINTGVAKVTDFSNIGLKFRNILEPTTS
jgi:hypothetical protein